ncbi:MAG: hypothetical protein HY326_02440, partial [Chloroflexi bacterium]|nr:hypothetical protein [Chloroflexota bacterium]
MDTNPTSAPLYLTDMDQCRPQSALSTGPKRNHWRLISYKTEAFSGNMLVAAHETNAPEVTYPLHVKGWHKISLGVYQER